MRIHWVTYRQTVYDVFCYTLFLGTNRFLFFRFLYESAIIYSISIQTHLITLRWLLSILCLLIRNLNKLWYVLLHHHRRHRHHRAALDCFILCYAWWVCVLCINRIIMLNAQHKNGMKKLDFTAETLIGGLTIQNKKLFVVFPSKTINEMRT